MNDISGSRILLNHLEPHKAEWSLGIQLTLDGNHAAELQFHKEQTLFGLLIFFTVKHLNISLGLISELCYWRRSPHGYYRFLYQMQWYPPPCYQCSITISWCQIVIMAKSNLYNFHSFLHLSALLKFGTLPWTMGQLLWHSYETFQIGLPG